MAKTQRLILYIVSIFLIMTFSACQKSEKGNSATENIESDTLTYQVDDSIDKIIESTEVFQDNDSPMLTVIIDDFGNYNNFMLDSLLVKFGKLPKEVSFAILPNLPYSEFVMEYFQYDDRELLLHSPLEPQNSKINAGDVVIKCEDDAITIINKLNDFYAKLPNVKGLNNHMGSKATEDVDVMTTILEWCQANNLYFIDSATTPKSVGLELARELGVPTAKRDIFLDVPNPSQETVNNYLEKMKKYYDTKRNILVITHASTLERRDNLQYFIDQAKIIGYRLVPVSEYISPVPKPI